MPNHAGHPASPALQSRGRTSIPDALSGPNAEACTEPVGCIRPKTVMHPVSTATGADVEGKRCISRCSMHPATVMFEIARCSAPLGANHNRRIRSAFRRPPDTPIWLANPCRPIPCKPNDPARSLAPTWIREFDPCFADRSRRMSGWAEPQNRLAPTTISDFDRRFATQTAPNMVNKSLLPRMIEWPEPQNDLAPAWIRKFHHDFAARNCRARASATLVRGWRHVDQRFRESFRTQSPRSSFPCPRARAASGRSSCRGFPAGPPHGSS
jgi:hypothetical protein